MEEQKEQQPTSTPEPGSVAAVLAAAEASSAELSADVRPASEPPKAEEPKEEPKAEEKPEEKADAKAEEPKAEEAGKPEEKKSRKERRAEWAAANRARIQAEKDAALENRLRKLEGGDKKVTKEDFPSEEAYFRYIAGEELKKSAAQAEQLREIEEAKAARYNSWSEKIKACIAPEELEDYSEAARAYGVDVSKAIGDDASEFIESSEVGPRILYMILENPRIAETLKNSRPFRAVRILSTLEAVASEAVKKMRGIAEQKGVETSAEAQSAGSVQSVAEAHPAPRATGALGNGSTVRDFETMNPDEMAASLQRKLRERRAQGFI